MEITIKRTLEKDYDLALRDWKDKTWKQIIYLLAILAIGIYFICNRKQGGEISTFIMVIGTVLITYPLALLRFHYALKAEYFEIKKAKIKFKIPYPTTVKISDIMLTISNPEFTISFNWEYFKMYKIQKGYIFIMKNSKRLGVVIETNELNETEQNDLVSLFRSKGLKNIS